MKYAFHLQWSSLPSFSIMETTNLEIFHAVKASECEVGWQKRSLGQIWKADRTHWVSGRSLPGRNTTSTWVSQEYRNLSLNPEKQTLKEFYWRKSIDRGGAVPMESPEQSMVRGCCTRRQTCNILLLNLGGRSSTLGFILHATQVLEESSVCRDPFPRSKYCWLSSFFYQFSMLRQKKGNCIIMPRIWTTCLAVERLRIPPWWFIYATTVALSIWIFQQDGSRLL